MSNNTSRNQAQLAAKPWSREYGEIEIEYWTVKDTSTGEILNSKVTSPEQANSLAQKDRVNYIVLSPQGVDVTETLANLYGY